MEIDKIVASGIGLRDIYSLGKFDIPEDSEVVLFDRDIKVKGFSVHYEDPLNLLINLCYDTNFLTTEEFKIYNTGHGYLEIMFGSYQYIVQFGDGIPQVESLREDDGTIVASSIIDSGLYIKDNSKILYNTPMPDPYNHDVTKYLFILNYTEYGKIIKDCLKKFIILDQYSYGKPFRIYYNTNSQEVYRMVETYNIYLKRAGWARKILCDSKYVIPGSRFTVLNTEDNRYYPMSLEGSGFKRFIHIVEAVEEANLLDVPLIIENYGEGIDEDKCEVLFNMIKESEINIVLSS